MVTHIDQMNRHRPSPRLLSVLLIVVAAFVIHGHVIDRFWLDDDPQVLLQALRHGPSDILLNPESWQELSGSNFTPLVTLSFDLDLSLFGPDPRFFYLHQILSIAIAAGLLRILMLELGISRRIALVGAMLFIAAPPTVHVAGHLMTRHYLEGLVLAIASLILWMAAVDRESPPSILVIGSGVAYFAALLAKEVFVLLPVVALVLAVDKVGRRTLAVRLIPHLLAFLVYLGWRGWILGGAGGYGERDLIAHVLEVGWGWITSSPIVAVWFLAMTVVILTGVIGKGAAVRFGLVSFAVLAPLAGVGDAIEPRHLFVPAAAAVIGAVFQAERFANPRLKAMALMILAVIAIVGLAVMMRNDMTSVAKMEAEGRYVWEDAADAAPLFAGSPGWYIAGVAELDRVVRSESSPAVVYSKLGLLVGADERFIFFDDRGLPRIGYVEEESNLRETFDPLAELNLRIERDGRALRWAFGPECDCEWRFYSYPDYQMFSVPRSGERVVPRPLEQQWFRIGRFSRDGRWTLSPPLALPEDGESTVWSRAAKVSVKKRSN